MAGKRNLNERAAAAGERARALDLGYLLMQAGFTREEVLEVIRIKNEKADRLTETGYADRQAVAQRLRVLRDAGYHGQATDAEDGSITIIVDGGKRDKPLDQVPAR